MSELDPAGGTHDGSAACPAHRWLRQEGPFRCVTGFPEASRLLSDPRLLADLRGLYEAAGVTEGPAWEAADRSLLSLNGAEHRRYRSVVAAGFSPKAVERSRPRIRRAAEAAADALRAETSGPVDVLPRFAVPFIVTSTFHHLGLPIELYERDASLATAVAQVGEASRDIPSRRELLAEGLDALCRIGREAVQGDLAVPEGSVMAALRAAVRDGTTPADVASVMTATFLSAGTEPTVNQVGLSILSLADAPDVWAALTDGPATTERTVEELLRYRSTNRMTSRRVEEPFSYEGTAFRADEFVLVSLHEADHDPRRFTSPDALDPVANDAPNVAFGFGAHYCLGASLARVQLQEGLRALTERFECPEVVDQAVTEYAGLTAPTRLVVRLTPRG